MGFEVTPERVARRRSVLPAVLASIAALGIVGAGLIGAWAPSGQRVHGPGAASLSPSSQAVLSEPSAAASVALGVLPSPGAIDCHDAGFIQCSRIVGAALQILPADLPPVESVGAWASILCRDTLDCPTGRFVGYQALGSAVVSFGPDHPEAWINVVAPVSAPGRGGVPTGLIAWVVQWRRG
jgi:hypothetical protein